jgi:hypothetical protein
LCTICLMKRIKVFPLKSAVFHIQQLCEFRTLIIPLCKCVKA